MTTLQPRPHIVAYLVTNRITGKTTVCRTSSGASRTMDRMDNAYGSYITTRKAVWSDEPGADKYTTAKGA